MFESASENKNTVSVVIPARNERHSLPLLIESIERQTIQPQEVIIADGMSTDGTREWLVDACKERPWLRFVDNPQQIISSALNTAIFVLLGVLAVVFACFLTFIIHLARSDKPGQL